MRIRKVSQPTQIEPGTAQITDTYSVSTEDGYSCNYINNHFSGITLYSSTDGNNTSITLSDAYTNYSRLKIYFYCHSSKVAYFTQEVDTNVDNFNLMGFYKASDYVGQLISAKFQMSGTSITYVNSSRLNANTTYSSSQVTMNTKDIYIYKVVGYR